MSEPEVLARLKQLEDAVARLTRLVRQVLQRLEPPPAADVPPQD
jgi:hypothetical protein